MAAKTYRLRLLINGREFEAEGDKTFVLSMLRRYGPSASDNASLPEPRSAETKKSIPLSELPKGKGISIREFIQQLNVKKHTDYVLAFGYYMERFQGKPDFSVADINGCYYEAKIESSNTSQMIANNIRTGRLMPSKKKGEGRKRFVVTNSGETFIDKKLHSPA